MDGRPRLETAAADAKAAAPSLWCCTGRRGARRHAAELHDRWRRLRCCRIAAATRHRRVGGSPGASGACMPSRDRSAQGASAHGPSGVGFPPHQPSHHAHSLLTTPHRVSCPLAGSPPAHSSFQTSPPIVPYKAKGAAQPVTVVAILLVRRCRTVQIDRRRGGGGACQHIGGIGGGTWWHARVVDHR